MNGRVPVAAQLRIALPWILVGGVLGSVIGNALGSALYGARAGIIAAGVVAFLILRRR